MRNNKLHGGKTMRHEWIEDMYLQYLRDMIDGEPPISLEEYTEIING